MYNNIDNYHRAFEELNRIKENELIGELAFEIGKVFFHAGRAGFSFDNQKALWVGKNIEESASYLKWDGTKHPVRKMYKLTTIKITKILLFKRNFTGGFFSDFCDTNHEEMAKVLTAWGSTLESADGISKIDGMAYEGRDELVFFKGGDIFRAEII